MSGDQFSTPVMTIFINVTISDKSDSLHPHLTVGGDRDLDNIQAEMNEWSERVSAQCWERTKRMLKG